MKIKIKKSLEIERKLQSSWAKKELLFRYQRIKKKDTADHFIINFLDVYIQIVENKGIYSTKSKETT